TLFEFVDLDGEPADDIFVDRCLTLDLCDGFARDFGRQHHIVTLAVLLDLVGELLEAPGLGLVDRALEFANDVGDGFRQRIDLSLAQILTRNKDMLVKRHDLRPSIWPIADFAPIAKPLRLSSGFVYQCKANGANGTRPRPECGRLYRFARRNQARASFSRRSCPNSVSVSSRAPRIRMRSPGLAS